MALYRFSFHLNVLQLVFCIKAVQFQRNKICRPFFLKTRFGHTYQLLAKVLRSQLFEKPKKMLCKADLTFQMSLVSEAKKPSNPIAQVYGVSVAKQPVK